MFFFLMKKAFFDGWDNLETIFITNFIFFIVSIALVWSTFIFLESSSPMFFVLLPMASIFVIMLLGVVSALMSALASYRRVFWTDVPRLFKETWKQCLVFGIAMVSFIIISLLGIIYYAKLKSLLGLIASMLTFWIVIGAYLTSIWYFPARNYLQGNFRKLLKKCVLLVIDNFLLSLYLGFVMIPLSLIAWPITAFVVFGPSGIHLYLNCTLRLLLYKYDWLKKNPDAKKVPWHEILVDEKKRIGKRTIEGMIFPWKE